VYTESGSNLPDTRYRCFDPADPPEWLDSRWWADTPNCNHLDNRVHRARLEAAARWAQSAAFIMDTSVIVDLGAGDGGLLSLLPEPYRSESYGYEIIADSVLYASTVRGVNVQHRDVLRDWINHDGVCVATEMLEHLEDPHAFLRLLAHEAGPRHLIASSPHSETVDGHHEWNHAWAWDRDGYRAMFEETGWTIERHEDVEWSQLVWAVR
jgi:2-polyprenyl-3-methyl-5-hydroxy-6-metoxy-1,4-benzoquinol methylase